LATVQKFANANTASTGAGFTNPINAYADDGSYATCAPGKNGGIGSDYGFPAFATQDIPDGATINSAAVEIQYKSSTTGSAGATMRLQLENGTLLGAEQSGGMSTSDTTLTHSVASGIALDDLRNANGVQARVTGRRGNSNTAITWSVDYVRLTVDYTPAVVGAGTAGLVLGASGAGVVADSEVSGDGAAALTLVASGQAVLPIAGTGLAGIGVTASGSGAVSLTGSGSAPLSLVASGAGSVPASGAGSAPMVLTVGGAGFVTVAGTGAASLTVTATGSGGAPATICDGLAVLALGASGNGTLPIAGDGSAVFILAYAADGAVRVVGTGLVPLAVTTSASGTAAPDPSVVVGGSVLVDLGLDVALAAVLEPVPVSRVARARSPADFADRVLGRSRKPWRR
jgi:hypothetical protein